MVRRWEGRFPGSCPAAVVLILLSISTRLESANSSETGCVPREIPADELAKWARTHSSDDVTRPQSGERRLRRRRRRLLVSDTDCSLENLCDPAARPRVCYYNSDICDGERDCDTGRDELHCEDCLCPYRVVNGASMNVTGRRVRYWASVNLKACARTCNDIEAGCVAFSFNALRRDNQRCKIFFQPGEFTANNFGGSLYVREAPSVPRLSHSAQSQSASLQSQMAVTGNCTARDMFECSGKSPKTCIPYSQVCDGIHQCPGSSEEKQCQVYLNIYSKTPGKTLGSYSAPLPPVSLKSCAGYCFAHSIRHPKCFFFSYRRSSRECLIGCSSCGDSPAIYDDSESDYYSVSLGGVVGLAGSFLEVYAGLSKNNSAAFQRFRPSLSSVTESLKTLGVSIPPDTPSGDDIRRIFVGSSTSRTAPPVSATVSPTSRPRPSFQGRPANQGSSPNQGFQPASFPSSNLAPSSVTSAPPTPPPTAAPSIPTPTPPLPARLPTDCGRRPLAGRPTSNTRNRVILSDGPGNRVVGGEAVDYGSYPWQAQIQAYVDGNFVHHCGGALIGERLVLTAAHCLRPALSRLQVKLGQHDRRDAGEQHEQTFAVENALTHPGYRATPGRGDADDIAVLKLRLRRGQPVVFSSHVQPLCLPSGPPPAGQECHVSGWGKTDPQLPDSPDSASDVLHGAAVPIVSDTLCSAREVYGGRFVAGRMVCAGHLAGGPDACQGDSGGPLACPGPDGRWQLTGIVSFGEGCGGLLKPGVYTRVGFYAPWIRRVVQLL